MKLKHGIKPGPGTSREAYQELEYCLSMTHDSVIDLLNIKKLAILLHQRDYIFNNRNILGQCYKNFIMINEKNCRNDEKIDGISLSAVLQHEIAHKVDTALRLSSSKDFDMAFVADYPSAVKSLNSSGLSESRQNYLLRADEVFARLWNTQAYPTQSGHTGSLTVNLFPNTFHWMHAKGIGMTQGIENSDSYRDFKAEHSMSDFSKRMTSLLSGMRHSIRAPS
jgi:hypothetical protein